MLFKIHQYLTNEMVSTHGFSQVKLCRAVELMAVANFYLYRGSFIEISNLH